MRFIAFLVPLTLFAEPVSFTFQDNSDNEDGFIVEAQLPSGEWEDLKILLADITEFEAEAGTHKAWRVRAFNAFGESGSTNEVKKVLPIAPSELAPKKRPTYGRYKSIHTRSRRKS